MKHSTKIWLAFLFGISFALAVSYCDKIYAQQNALTFRDWYGTYEHKGRKQISTFSNSDVYMLMVFVDDQLITRLEFHPNKKIKRVEFDGKSFRMNYNSRFLYGPWAKRMKKYRTMWVWFEGEKKAERFSLKGFSAALRWLNK